MLSYSTPFSGYSFSYDARNRLTESFVGAIGTSWLINGLGQRIAQMNGSVPQFFFVYDEAGHPIGKYDGGGNSLQETVWLGDLPAAVLQPSGQFYIAPDHLGSPHQITDASGAVVWLWNHDPFGSGDPQGTFTYELRFPGQFYDQLAKLHYNYFRDYDPRTGRYSESDPIGLAGGINTYAYAGGNPISNIDPKGTQTIPLPWAGPCLADPFCAGALAAVTVGALICERRTFSSAGGGGRDPHKKCLDAAGGSDSDWENFCSSIPFSEQNNVVGGGSAQRACQSKTYASPVEKRNWCENQYGNH